MTTNNSCDYLSPIAISSGGTNASSFGTSNGLVKYDGTGLVTSTTATLDASNRMQNTSQPAFSAYKSATTNSITGNGTYYSVVFDTKLFDQNSNYNNGTGYFTAPVTGRYQFSYNIWGSNATTASEMRVKLVVVGTSAKIYYMAQNRTASSATLQVSNTVFAPMTATDTAHVEFYIFGDAANSDGVLGNADAYTYFSGHLVC